MEFISKGIIFGYIFLFFFRDIIQAKDIQEAVESLPEVNMIVEIADYKSI